MSENVSPPKKRGLLKKLGLVAGILFLLLVVGYFILTSGAFFKGVILPKVAKAMNADVTVGDASISPFSQVVLRDFKVRTSGAEPVLSASEIRARYSLFAILGGQIKVEEVTVLSPVVQIVQNADGTSNLDPLMKSSPPSEKKSEPPAGSKPPQIDIKRVSLKNALVRVVKNHAGGGRDLTELSNFNFSLDNLKNGQTGKMTVGAELKSEQNPPAPGTNASLQATLGGNFSFDLSADLKPGAVKGNAKFDVTRAGGAFTDLASFAASLDCDASPAEIKLIALRFQKGGANLGEIRVSGPFDAAKSEGSLKLEILNIDKQVLNLAGASSGLDFGPTTIRSTNRIDLTKAGDAISVAGQLDIARFSVTQKGQTTPALDLQLAYSVAANTKDKTAQVQTLTMNGTQNQRPLLISQLASPMNLAWGPNASAGGDSTLNVTLTNLNLADWKPFLGENASAGMADATLNLVSKQAGKQLALDLAAQLNGLTAKFGTNSIQEAGATLVVRGQAVDFNKINLTEYRLQLTHRTQPMVAVSGLGTVDVATKDADLQMNLEATPARLFAALPQPGLSVTTGLFTFNSHVVRQGQAQMVTGTLTLTNLTGRSGEYSFTNFGANAELDLATQGEQLNIRKARLALTPTPRGTNIVVVTGQVDMTRSNAIQGGLKLVSESLDVTPFYDLFTGKTQPAATSTASSPAPAPTPPASKGPGPEPAPITLPFQNFNAELNIARFYLREIAITNWQTGVKLDGSRVAVNPCQLLLNGAPVQATVALNLGVPGYEYDVAFRGEKIPLEPLANSFSPDYHGQAKGDLLASAQIKGAGITDANLQKHLSAKIDFTFTNAIIQVSGPKARNLIVPISLALRLPELKQSPINWLDTSIKIGEGKINLDRFNIVSAAFTADTAGVIPMAPVLASSPLNNMPVNFALRRSLAAAAHLISADTPTNAAYAKLPTFIKLAGTIGDSKVHIDEIAVIGMAAKSVSGIPGLGGEKTTRILENVEGLLKGGKASGTNGPASTNSSGTNPPAKSGLLDFLNKPKK